MSRKKKVEFEYAQQFDKIMEERFGEKFKTEWDVLAGSFGEYTTTRANGRRLTNAMILFGSGVSAGMATAQSHYNA